MKKWYVYIITNKRNGTLYIGVTNDIKRRIYEHKNKIYEWFSKKYWLDKLVYFEEYNNIVDAIGREKYLKWMCRDKKVHLIEQENLMRDDLLIEI
jgi:putative endonuclease